MIIYFDTETTDLYPGNICQLSYIMQRGDELTAKNFFFSVDYMSASAARVHGFTKQRLEVLSGGKTFYSHKDEIHEDFKNSDLIIAHNLPFDLNFMIREFEANQMQFLYKDGLCSMRKLTPVCKLPKARGGGYKYPKLTELAEVFDLYPYDCSINTIKHFKCDVGAHDARYDTTLLYLAMQRAIEKDPELKEFIHRYI